MCIITTDAAILAAVRAKWGAILPHVAYESGVVERAENGWRIQYGAGLRLFVRDGEVVE